ncbi:2-amino-4-hydroxy-6-hydroxymethyldihydropteridine diphosphokinase [Thiogranum longum]|uniref:2-amino-4-hydroxy-6-hydroxymethyldihydropteridine pyrophosphokinase n=1 Tax=Thiogranum longum TaxID=1537524 RepID=A0A4R1HFJ2_9GAMM|nr:2-amino-4-hydroxy-6-hydroxymethyldihydropteridine diphosphokinase [Thiogranum longum]TCK19000.1 2-amino-4-hydroxy-6-hydroxymethyldihydropteridine diphosphokinase [Thiogranum longum]
MTEIVAWIGLGSNLNDPARQVNNALAELDQLPRSRLLVCSGLYRSAPMGPQDQPDYINAVAGLATALPAAALLDLLQAIEQAHRRVRGEHWGPRTLDLDILLYGDERIETPGLKVPHPGMVERNFVLAPLAEVAPQLLVPGLGEVQALCNTVSDVGLERVGDAEWHATAPDPDVNNQRI